MVTSRAGLVLVIAPLLVLSEQALAFALVPLSCAAQSGPWLHAVAAAALLLGVAIAVVTSRSARSVSPERLLLARMAGAMAWLSVAVLLALWLPVWVLEPCL
jgi:hypothetical protein